MNKLFRHSLSLKNQLIISFMLIAFIPAGIISLFFFLNARNTLEKSIGEGNYKIISNIQNNVENKVQQAKQFMDWIYINDDVMELLNRPSDHMSVYDGTKKQAVESIEKQFRYLPITNHITALFIIGNNGLDIRNGIDAYKINIDLLINEAWYQKGVTTAGRLVWGGIAENYTKVSHYKYVISLFRTVNDIHTGRELGSFVLLFNERFSLTPIRAFPLTREKISLLLMNPGMCCPVIIMRG